VHREQGPGLFPDVFNVQNMHGSLLQVVPDAPRIGSYYFVTRSDRENEPRIVRLREWLTENLKDA
jgi:DNA-binding transcriptional LysR family regulator